MVWVHISYILYMAIGGLRFRLKFTSLGALERQALLVRTCADSILFGWSNIHTKKMIIIRLNTNVRLFFLSWPAASNTVAQEINGAKGGRKKEIIFI